MLRFVHASRVVRSLFPAAYAPAYGAATALGSATFLTFFLAACYWSGKRRKLALVISYGFAALGAVLTLKYLLAMPRPPQSAMLVAAFHDPYGFPSGHATAAVVVYGGLAATIDDLRRPRWIGVAGIVAVVVGLSRVALGVHYLGDVLAGFVLGGVLLAALHRGTDGDPRRGFAAAVVLAVCAIVATHGSAEAIGALGGSIGGLVGSLGLSSVPDPRNHADRVVAVVVGLAVVLAVHAGGDAFDALGGLAGATATAGTNLVLVAAILLVPAGVRAVRSTVAAESSS